MPVLCAPMCSRTSRSVSIPPDLGGSLLPFFPPPAPAFFAPPAPAFFPAAPPAPARSAGFRSRRVPSWLSRATIRAASAVENSSFSYRAGSTALNAAISSSVQTARRAAAFASRRGAITASAAAASRWPPPEACRDSAFSIAVSARRSSASLMSLPRLISRSSRVAV